MKLLKFGAKWCPGCIIMKPRLEEIEKENSWLQTEYFDADENKDLVDKYELTDLPSFVFLDSNNTLIEKLSGVISKEKIVSLINEYKDK